MMSFVRGFFGIVAVSVALGSGVAFAGSSSCEAPATTAAPFGGTCGGSGEPAAVASPSSSSSVGSESYEMFSWKDHGTWCFTLLQGANAAKDDAVIRSSGERFRGFAALRKKLATLKGTMGVVWQGHTRQSSNCLPPKKQVEEIRRFAEKHGVTFDVLK